MFGFQDFELEKPIEFFFLDLDDLNLVRTLENLHHFCVLFRRVELACLEIAAALVLDGITPVQKSEQDSASVMVEVRKKAVWRLIKDLITEANQKVIACSKTTGGLSFATMEMAKPMLVGTTTGWSRASLDKTTAVAAMIVTATSVFSVRAIRMRSWIKQYT